MWFFRGVMECLTRIRLVFGVSSLIFHFKIAFVCVTITLNPTAPWPCRHPPAFPPRGARPTTAFRGFMAARASNERAFAFGVSSDRSEGGGATARWRIRAFAAARSRRVCARGAANQQKIDTTPES